MIKINQKSEKTRVYMAVKSARYGVIPLPRSVFTSPNLLLTTDILGKVLRVVR